ncbi:hypothetical protein ACFO5R_03745 [Halosolutus amylolyticus]|uniref:Uncharacterized protein n=1 Tax=Halosolutus amylolyticus TaxID=2932267 RepID=A0ABD5PKC9_9EURY|nr:hypothetical protein [Halosolutus amylolyticus]
MHRRSFIGVAVAVAVAGCSEVTGAIGIGDDGIDETLEDEKTAEFSAEAGDEYTVTVDVERVDEGTAVSVQVAKIGEGPLVAQSIEDSATLDVTIETDGEHVITVTNGAAHVTLEAA